MTMRTCPGCKRVLATERARIKHQVRACWVALDYTFAEQQHAHRIAVHGRR